MLTKSLMILDTTKTESSELKFFQSDKKNSTKLLPLRFQECFGPFNILTVHKCSGTGIFKHLINHAASSL